MQEQALAQAWQECHQGLSFGETLGDILADFKLPQKVLVFKLKSVGLNWSDNKVSRLVNNEIPNNLKAREVHKIAQALNCDTRQLAMLIRAYTCHKLKEWELI
ncbi:MAG TPA: hypothetical protein VMT24_15400 [Aggregatilineaceae bacterium]|nr:hypothetical protein [Aggregatilineaceae bacterium]